MPKPSAAEQPMLASRYLVREDKSISTQGGLVKFALNAEISDPYLVRLAREHGVPLIPLE